VGKGKLVRDDQKLVHCSRCDKWKPREEFNIRNKRLNLLQYVCRDCQKQQGRDRYASDKAHVRQINNASRDSARAKAREYVYGILAGSGCTDCGETDIRVLTFHHVRGVKRYSIGELVTRGMALESIQAEVSKCIVLCHNCHAKRTQKLNGLFKGWLPFLKKS
jgi:hypothetical protein